MKFEYDWPSGFRGETSETVDGQTTEPAFTVSSPRAFGSGELKSLS